MDECIVCTYREHCESLNYLDVANTCSDLREFVDEIRADAIEEFKSDMLNKICFEEKWLMKSKSDNADTDIMFSALKTFCESISEKLKNSK